MLEALLYVAGMWLLASLCITTVLCRWFRVQRALDEDGLRDDER